MSNEQNERQKQSDQFWGFIGFAILVVFVIYAFSSAKDTSKPVVTMQDCLEQSQWEYGGECVEWEEIPEEDTEQVLSEVADTIAEREGITREEALTIMLEVIEGAANGY